MSKMAEFEKIRALFTAWAEHGVPAGVAYPRTQTEAVGWKCEQFGIIGIGSKSYFKTTSVEYGLIVSEIKDLISRLKPEDEVQRLTSRKAEQGEAPVGTNKRVYKTQKARRHLAEDRASSLDAENISLLSQLQQTREELAAVQLKLKIAQQTVEQMRQDKAKSDEDNARLTRMLAARQGLLQVVE